ncbi:MAG: hypothetical protein WCZ87_13355, partial [Thiohalobacteraceae bacterium]
VDTHIFRVANRTGLAPGKTPLEVERRLLKFVADEFKHDAHHWLILLGRYICVARTPKCPECPINDLCEYRAKTTYAAAATKLRPTGSVGTRAKTAITAKDAKARKESQTRGEKKNQS